MKIVIKIGSAVLMKEDNAGIDIEVLSNIVEQFVKLKAIEQDIIIVTSGAVASCKDDYSQSLRAAIGQPRLIGLYQYEFGRFSTKIAQLLLTHDNLETSQRQNVRQLLFEALNMGVVPIINANDSVSSKELDALQEFADNDALAAKITKLIEADLLIMLIKEKGLMDFGKNKAIHDAGDINNYKRFLEIMSLAKGKNKFGVGGMISKINVARNLVCNFPEYTSCGGIEVRLLPGRQKNAILDSLDGKRVGTVFRVYKNFKKTA